MNQIKKNIIILLVLIISNILAWNLSAFSTKFEDNLYYSRCIKNILEETIHSININDATIKARLNLLNESYGEMYESRQSLRKKVDYFINHNESNNSSNKY